MSSLSGFRTLIVAAVMAMLGVVQSFDWATIIPQNQTWSGIAMIGVGALMAVMRAMTTTPVGVAAPPVK